MRAVQVLRSLGPIDARSVVRDSLLRWALVLPLLGALVVRWLLPLMLARMGEAVQADLLSSYAPLAGAVLLLLAPMMAGMVVGFLLLDQRDDGSLRALQVTPLPLSSYLVYRLAAPMLLSLVLTLAMFPLAGFMALSAGALLLAALAAAPLAPLLALGLAVVAENKVQGFALLKASGLPLVVPLAAYFVQGPWQLAFGIVPTYWPSRLYWALLQGEPQSWLYLGAGLAYQALLLWLLLRRFETVMHR